MSTIKNLIAGLAGAIALNILHESLKKKSNNTPRIDLLGQEALQKTLHHLDKHINHKKNLYRATLTSDLISNSIYYSLIGAGNPKHIWPKAALLGIGAGIGAIKLPSPMGLNPEPVAKNNTVKSLTIAYYLLGAAVTGLALTLMNKSGADQ